MRSRAQLSEVFCRAVVRRHARPWSSSESKPDLRTMAAHGAAPTPWQRRVLRSGFRVREASAREPSLYDGPLESENALYVVLRGGLRGMVVLSGVGAEPGCSSNFDDSRRQRRDRARSTDRDRGLENRIDSTRDWRGDIRFARSHGDARVDRYTRPFELAFRRESQAGERPRGPQGVRALHG